MRHRVAGKQLGRNHNERQLLLRNLLFSFLQNGKIKTTQAKITAVRPLISKSVRTVLTKDRLVASRFLGRYINSRSNVKAIIDRFSASYTDGARPSLSVVKIQRRVGDDALISELSLTPALKPLVKPEVKETKKAKPVTKATKPVTKKKSVVKQAK
jgi:large subunit ribosomal protein L17